MNKHHLAFVIALSVAALSVIGHATAPPDGAAPLGPPAVEAPDGFEAIDGVDLAIAGREAATEAWEHARADRPEEALGQFQLALYANPYQSGSWFGQGEALKNLGRYDEAIESFRTTLELGARGWFHDRAMYNIAACHAQLNEKDEAFAALEQVMRTEGGMNSDLLRTDPTLDSLRDDPRWSQVVPIDAPDGLTRDDGWRYDLDVFKKRIKDLHYDFDTVTSEAVIDAAIADLRERVSGLTDDAITLEIQRVLVMLGDGHTSLGSWPAAGAIPIVFRLYSDGLFVQAASGDHADTAGWRLVGLGGQESGDVLARIEPYIAQDNHMGFVFSGPSMMSQLSFLRHLGLVDGDDTVEIELEDLAGKRHTRRVSAGPVDADTRWVRARDGAEAPEPLYLGDQLATYWFEHLPEHDLVYFQFNRIASDADEPIERFMTRLFEFIEANNVGHLAIDLRFNGGGNSYLNSNLTNALIRAERINQSERLFVITGRNTFSAAMNLTTDLDVMTNASFIGEPASSRPNFIGESQMVQLPYSGLQFSCSTRMHQRGMDSTDQRKLIAPDYYVPQSSADYRLNRDPVMDTIIEIIKRQRDMES